MYSRLQNLRSKMKQIDLPALFITHSPNCRYISGFDGSSGALLITGDQGFLITDSRYLEQAREQAPEFSVISCARNNPAKYLDPLLEESRIGVLGFEEKHLSFFNYQNLAAGLNAELRPGGGLVEQLRAVKDPVEIDVLRRGAALADEGFEHILNFIQPGMTERQIGLELEYHQRQKGAEGIPFPYIVVSGVRGALPHGMSTNKVLGKGELLTIDFGAVWEGYATDMTRTIALGRPDRRQREMYGIVQEAQRAAREGLKAGLRCSEADALARGPIREAGWGDYFVHGLGHGVGLEVHEQPVISPYSEEVLLPGMVVTVEPGLYIPGWGGIRIEDMVLLTDDGAEPLTASSRELIVV